MNTADQRRHITRKDLIFLTALSYTSRQHRNVGKAETTPVAVCDLHVGDVVTGRGRVLAITPFGQADWRFVSFVDGNDVARLSARYEVVTG